MTSNTSSCWTCGRKLLTSQLLVSALHCLEPPVKLLQSQRWLAAPLKLRKAKTPSSIIRQITARKRTRALLGFLGFGFTGCEHSVSFYAAAPAASLPRKETIGINPRSSHYLHFQVLYCPKQLAKDYSNWKKLADVKVSVTSLYYPQHLEPNQQSFNNLLTIQTLQIPI